MSRTTATADVVVVGGSLAGAATAIHLAESGRKVVVLERRREFRRKACGEGLFPLGVRELMRLGVLAEIRHDSRSLDGVRFRAGGALAMAYMEGALGIRREVLDPALLNRAENAGVQLLRGTTVTGLLREGPVLRGVTTDGGNVLGGVVVGADGLHSRMRRLARLERKARGSRYGISAHVRLERQLEPFVDVSFLGDHEMYVTPVDECVANVALLTRKRGMRQFAGNLNSAFSAAVRSLPHLKGSFELLDEPLVAGPFSANCSRVWRANLVLVGDAAGFFDGITGEGMSVSLVAARHCARACDEYLSGGGYAPFREYARTRASLVRNSDLLGRVSLALGSRPSTARMAVRNLQRRPETFNRLVAISSGASGLQALRPRDLSALLFGR